MTAVQAAATAGRPDRHGVAAGRDEVECPFDEVERT